MWCIQTTLCVCIYGGVSFVRVPGWAGLHTAANNLLWPALRVLGYGFTFVLRRHGVDALGACIAVGMADQIRASQRANRQLGVTVGLNWNDKSLLGVTVE